MARSDLAVTHKELLGWVFGAFLAALLAGWGFFSRAEASAEKVEIRIDQRLTRIEAKLDRALEGLKAAP